MFAPNLIQRLSGEIFTLTDLKMRKGRSSVNCGLLNEWIWKEER